MVRGRNTKNTTLDLDIKSKGDVIMKKHFWSICSGIILGLGIFNTNVGNPVGGAYLISLSIMIFVIDIIIYAIDLYIKMKYKS